VERGQRQSSADFARVCDSALAAGGALAALRPLAQPRVSAPADAGVSPDFPDFPRSMLDAYADPAGFGVPATSDAGVLDHFTRIFGDLRTLGQQTYAAHVLPIAACQARVLRPSAEKDVTMALLAARCAEYTGWMAQELGLRKAASAWTDEAVLIAAAAGDRGFAAYAMVRRAEFALHRNEPWGARELAALVRDDEKAPVRVRQLAAHREAQAHALYANAAACDRALAQAIEFGAQIDSTAENFGSATIGSLDQSIAGWCNFDLGRLDEAAAMLEQVVGELPAWACRARGRHLVRLARTWLADGDVDRAAATTHAALDDIGRTHSAGALAELRHLSTELARKHRHPAARELRLTVLAALRDAGTAA
jgi:hypothetical protein